MREDYDMLGHVDHVNDNKFVVSKYNEVNQVRYLAKM